MTAKVEYHRSSLIFFAQRKDLLQSVKVFKVLIDEIERRYVPSGYPF